MEILEHIQLVKALTPKEWEAVKRFREQYCNHSKKNREDPETWTFEHHDHMHFILYEGIDIIGYAHLQLLTYQRATLHTILIDEHKRHHHFGEQFLRLCEAWLKNEDYRVLYVVPVYANLGFYRRHGFIHMPFDKTDDYVNHFNEMQALENMAMGKLL